MNRIPIMTLAAAAALAACDKVSAPAPPTEQVAVGPTDAAAAALADARLRLVAALSEPQLGQELSTALATLEQQVVMGNPVTIHSAVDAARATIDRYAAALDRGSRDAPTLAVIQLTVDVVAAAVDK